MQPDPTAETTAQPAQDAAGGRTGPGGSPGRGQGGDAAQRAVRRRTAGTIAILAALRTMPTTVIGQPLTAWQVARLAEYLGTQLTGRTP